MGAHKRSVEALTLWVQVVVKQLSGEPISCHLDHYGVVPLFHRGISFNNRLFLASYFFVFNFRASIATDRVQRGRLI